MSNSERKPPPRSDVPSEDVPEDVPASSERASAPRTVENPLSVADPSKPRCGSKKPLATDVLALVVRESNLPGADDDDESEAGDRALPAELLELITRSDAQVAANDNRTVTPERRRLWDRLQKTGAIRARIKIYLMGRHGVPDADAEDIINNTYYRMLGAKKWPTDETKSLYGFVRKFANFTRLRHQRSSERREKREQPDEKIEWHAAPQADEEDPEAKHNARLAAANHVASQKPEHAQAYAVLLKSKATNRPVNEVSIAEGLNPATTQKRIERFSEAVRRYALLGGTTSLVMGVVLFMLIVPGLVTVMSGHSTAPHPGAGDPLSWKAEATAPELRARAFGQCEKGKYEVCLRILDKAKELDPAGDADPAVVKARGDAEKALHTPSHP